MDYYKANKNFLLNCHRVMEKAMKNRGAYTSIEISSQLMMIDDIAVHVAPELRSAKLELYREGDLFVIGLPLKQFGVNFVVDPYKTMEYNPINFLKRHFAGMTPEEFIKIGDMSPVVAKCEKELKGWGKDLDKVWIRSESFSNFKNREILPLLWFDFQRGLFIYGRIGNPRKGDSISSFDTSIFKKILGLNEIPWSTVAMRYKDVTGEFHEFHINRGF